MIEQLIECFEDLQAKNSKGHIERVEVDVGLLNVSIDLVEMVSDFRQVLRDMLVVVFSASSSMRAFVVVCARSSALTLASRLG